MTLAQVIFVYSETEKLHQERTEILSQLDITHDGRIQELRKTHNESMIAVCQDFYNNLKLVYIKHHGIVRS